eukprot:TCONS_00007161-protein
MRVQQPNVCSNIFSYVNLRQETTSTRISDDFKSSFSALRLPEAMRENELAFGEYDKIFAAEWLNEDHIICGTKCNNLIVQNITSQSKWEIPLMKGSGHIPIPDKNCGIHSISKNENNTKLATGALNPNSIGFYRLPSLEPICLGEFHTDWIFSSAWINDNTLATGSRDNRLAFWTIPDEIPHSENDEGERGKLYPIVQPVQHFQGVGNKDKVRAMVYNSLSEHLATIASNGYLHLWDVNTCQRTMTTTLPFMKENVCIAHEKKNNLLYAVGSLSHVSLVDTHGGKSVASLCSSEQGAGVRSVSFNDCIVTVGTGYGSLLFYDIRMNRLLQRQDGTQCQLKVGHGWLRRDLVYQQYFWEAECYPNAIYAHSYHPTTMKLLSAGGPLALGLYGNYLAYWD